MPVDAVGIAKDTYSLGMAIYEKAEQVKANRAQCKRLGQRVLNIIEQLPSGASIKRMESKGINLKPPFQKLMTCLEECSKQVDRYRKKHWFKEIIVSGWDKDKFEDLTQQLSQAIDELNLALTIKISVAQVFDREQDESDRQQDKKDLLNEIEVVIKLQQLTLEHTMAMGIELKDFIELQSSELKRHIEILLEERVQSPIGQLIDKHLRIPAFEVSWDKKIGEGSFSRVYQGRWHEQVVAVKEVKEPTLHEQQKEFVREVQIMSRLRSPYIVQVFGACLDLDPQEKQDKKALIIMEYMKRGSLASIIKSKSNFDQLSPKLRHQISMDIVHALYYMHQKSVLHRDLNPNNVLLDNLWRAKLTDFGLSKIRALSVASISKKTLATRWQAPEIFTYNSLYTEASDIYSLGLLLWSLWTGKIPYLDVLPAGSSILTKFIPHIQGNYREKIPQDVPSLYASLIASCWSTDPDKRPSLLDVLKRLHAAPTFEYPLPKPNYSPRSNRLFSQGRQSKQEGKLDEAKQKFEQGGQRGDCRAHFLLAEVLEEESLNEQAYSFYEKSADHEFPQAQLKMGELSTAQGNRDMAMHYYQRVLINEGQQQKLPQYKAQAEEKIQALNGDRLFLE